MLPPDDEAAWREALAEMARDRNARNEYARRARELASLFTLERMVDRYEDFLGDPGD